MAAVAGKGARRGTGREEGRGGRGREGETAARDEIVVAVGVNCSDPDYIEVTLYNVTLCLGTYRLHYTHGTV